MIDMIYTVLSRFIKSYTSVVLQLARHWPLPFRVLFVPLSFYFYCLTFLVVSTVMLIVIFIACPLSYASKVLFNQ